MPARRRKARLTCTRRFAASSRKTWCITKTASRASASTSWASSWPRCDPRTLRATVAARCPPRSTGLRGLHCACLGHRGGGDGDAGSACAEPLLARGAEAIAPAGQGALFSGRTHVAADPVHVLRGHDNEVGCLCICSELVQQPLRPLRAEQARLSRGTGPVRERLRHWRRPAAHTATGSVARPRGATPASSTPACARMRRLVPAATGPVADGPTLPSGGVAAGRGAHVHTRHGAGT